MHQWSDDLLNIAKNCSASMWKTHKKKTHKNKHKKQSNTGNQIKYKKKNKRKTTRSAPR